MFFFEEIGTTLYLNSLKRKGDPRVLAKLSDEGEAAEIVKPEDITGPNELPLSDSVDKLTVHLGLVILAYVMGFGIISLATHFILLSGVAFLIDTVMPLLWSFNFIFGTICGIIVKSLLVAGKNKGVIKRRYIRIWKKKRRSNYVYFRTYQPWILRACWCFS